MHCFQDVESVLHTPPPTPLPSAEPDLLQAPPISYLAMQQK